MSSLFSSMVYFTLFFWRDPFHVFSVSRILGASKTGKSVGKIWACWMSHQYPFNPFLYLQFILDRSGWLHQVYVDPQAFILSGSRRFRRNRVSQILAAVAGFFQKSAIFCSFFFLWMSGVVSYLNHSNLWGLRVPWVTIFFVIAGHEGPRFWSWWPGAALGRGRLDWAHLG